MQRTRRKYDGFFTVRYGGGLSPVLRPKLVHEFIPIIVHVKAIVRFV